MIDVCVIYIHTRRHIRMYTGRQIYTQTYMYIHFNDIAFRKTKKFQLALYSIIKKFFICLHH